MPTHRRRSTCGCSLAPWLDRIHRCRRRTPRPMRCSPTSPMISPTSSASRPAAATPGTSAKRDILRQNYLGGGSPEFGGTGRPLRQRPAPISSGKREVQEVHPARVGQLQADRGSPHLRQLFEGLQRRRLRSARASAPMRQTSTAIRRRSDEEIADFLSFDPETVDSYELGYKGSLLDNRLNVAVAAFHANYKDVQIPGSVACTSSRTVLPTFCGIVSNAGKARFQGLEFEGNARRRRKPDRHGGPADVWRRRSATSTPTIRNISPILPPRRPTWPSSARSRTRPNGPASGTLNYTTPLGGGDLNFNTTVSYRSKTVQFEIPNPIHRPGGLFAVGREPRLYCARRPLERRHSRQEPARQGI